MLNTILTMSTLYFFIISLINVILSSTKSICTVRYGRGINVIANVVSYSFYNVVVKQTASLPLSTTVAATAVANALGVWLSYVVLDAIQKDRLWKLEVVVSNSFAEDLYKELKNFSPTYVEMGPRTLFNCYCDTRKATVEVLKCARKYNGKVFAIENKL